MRQGGTLPHLILTWYNFYGLGLKSWMLLTKI